MAYPSPWNLPTQDFAKPKPALQPQTQPPAQPAPTQPRIAQEGPGMIASPTTVTRTAPAAPAPTGRPGSRSEGFTYGVGSTGMQPGGSTITSVSPTAAAPGTPFTDIRSRMFLPSTSGTQQAGAQTDQVAGRLTNYQFPQFQGVGAGSYEQSPEVMQLRQRIMDQLEAGGRPDRGGLAMQAFDLMRTRSDPAFQQTLRQVGQKNAALGRLGAGMVTNELMDVTAQRERDLSLAQKEMALDAAGMSLQDKLAQLNASQGVFDQFSGADRADAGVRLGLRNEARDERGAGLAYGLDQFQAQSGLLGQLGNLEGMRFNQGSQMRDEMRGERAWQQGMNQQAMDNALRERLTQEQIFGNDYDRMLRGAATFGQLGFGQDGSGAYLAGAGQYGQQAAGGREALGDLAQNWSYIDWARRNGAIVN